MGLLGELFVGNPARILGIAAAFAAPAWLSRRRALRVPAMAWALHALWGRGARGRDGEVR